MDDALCCNSPCLCQSHIFIVPVSTEKANRPYVFALRKHEHVDTQSKYKRSSTAASVCVQVNDEGYTPLMEAAREGHEEMVALLLAQGEKVAVKNPPAVSFH